MHATKEQKRKENSQKINTFTLAGSFSGTAATQVRSSMSIFSLCEAPQKAEAVPVMVGDCCNGVKF